MGRRSAVAVKSTAVVRPVRPWVQQPYYGARFDGVTLGAVIAVNAVPTSQSIDLCWYWSNSSKTRGYWAPLRFCGQRDCSVTLCVYSLIAVIATASVTHAFSQNNLLAQPRASGSAKRIISSGGRACEAQPSRRGKFFVLQLDTALEALA